MEYTKTVFLHIGTHKTGTTAIQHTLRDNQDLLGSNGYHFIARSLLYQPVQKLQGFAPDRIEREKRNYHELIENSKCGNLIFSYENFSGDLFNAYSDAPLWAQTLSSIFGNHSVKIIIYLRRQDQFIESAYVQSIKQGCGWTFANFCDIVDIHGFNWYNHLTHYAQYFGNDSIIVRPYESVQLQNGNVVPDFLQILGIPSDAIPVTSHRENRSYSRSALELARIYNSAVNRDDVVLMRKALDQVQVKQQSGDDIYSSSDNIGEFIQRQPVRVREMLHTIAIEDRVDDNVSFASAMRSQLLHRLEEYGPTRDQQRIRKILEASNTKRPFEDFGFFPPAERLKFLNYYDESNSRVAHKFFSREDGRLFRETIYNDDGRPFQQQGLSTDELTVNVMNIFLKADINRDQLFTIALIGKIERLALKLSRKLRINNFLYRLYLRGYKIIERL